MFAKCKAYLTFSFFLFIRDKNFLLIFILQRQYFFLLVVQQEIINVFISTIYMEDVYALLIKTANPIT